MATANCLLIVRDSSEGTPDLTRVLGAGQAGQGGEEGARGAAGPLLMKGVSSLQVMGRKYIRFLNSHAVNCGQCHITQEDSIGLLLKSRLTSRLLSRKGQALTRLICSVRSQS